jgi:hypothetical protein
MTRRSEEEGMARWSRPVVALAGVIIGASWAFAADSATSQPGVIDSRLRASGSSASAPLVEARSGHDSVSEETFTLDTATAIGTLIMFR